MRITFAAARPDPDEDCVKPSLPNGPEVSFSQLTLGVITPKPQSH
jgi:hypothetical protein